MEIKGIGQEGYKAKVKGKIKPIRDNVLVADMDFGERKVGMFILPSDDGKTEGVRHRWGRVWAIGPQQQDVKVGDWILVEHGRWTRGITVENDDGEDIVIRRIDLKAILMVSDEKPDESLDTWSTHSRAQGQTFTPEMFGAQ
jgi:co-chaperonin GroES (HSP10)